MYETRRFCFLNVDLQVGTIIPSRREISGYEKPASRSAHICAIRGQKAGVFQVVS